MQNSFFYKLGIKIYRWKAMIISLWLFAILCCAPTLPKLLEPFKSSGFENFSSESQAALSELEDNVGYQKHKVLILFKKKFKHLGDERFKFEVESALKNLNSLPKKHELIVGPIQNNRAILAILSFRKPLKLTEKDLQHIESKVKTSKYLEIHFGGEDVFLKSINQQTQKDLFRADTVAAPISILTLILVFGSLVAALMPIFVGGCCAVIMLGLLHYTALHASLSIFTINIALLLGLCLSLDYALFIISRFKEEFLNSNNIEEVLAKTMATSGKAVFFSGLAVFASLSALLLFPINILVSVGVGGLCAVLLAVVGAVTLLPALLAYVKQGIHIGMLFKPKLNTKDSMWKKVATLVTRSPYIFSFLGLTLLAICVLPIKNLKLGIYDYHILPPHSEGRLFFKEFTKFYDEQELSPILVLVESKNDILSSQNIKKTYELQAKIKQLKHVDSVSGYLNWIPQGKLSDYQGLYSTQIDRLPQNIQQIIKTSVGKHMAVFYVLSDANSDSDSTKELIKKIRHLNVNGLYFRVAGIPANNYDVFNGIKEIAPHAILLILLTTFIVLLLLLKSVFLPFKAIVMNILSLLATYGCLVYIFQMGHGQTLLNFDSQGSLDISMLVIIFCALFGFSMDYEVFLLTRIQEAYERTKDNTQSIIFGIDHSAKIITSAAWIVIVLCGSFLIADVMMVKAFGLGIAIAIFLDAFIIRILLVPAIMTITRKINWLCPRWLQFK
jgi:RND superfamily putative drug exporter